MVQLSGVLELMRSSLFTSSYDFRYDSSLSLGMNLDIPCSTLKLNTILYLSNKCIVA